MLSLLQLRQKVFARAAEPASYPQFELLRCITTHP